jgi:alkylation response protein AidB-like acyl-CoA dehydrogenase
MDFRFSPEDEAFRQEVHTFVKREWDDRRFHMNDVSNASWHLDDTEALAAAHDFAKKLINKGWYTMHWPTEHGGQNVPLARMMVYREEMAYTGAPVTGASSGDAVILHGAPWQKQEWLPKIASAEMQIALGLSEPGNGSDLAGVQTRAVQDGDDWVINGQKMWTSTAHHSNWIRMLVRTDPQAPKHRGLSIFFVPLDTPGITIRPIHDMAGRRRWSEEFFEDVRVPSRYMLGEANRGWYVMAASLTSERVEVGSPAALLREWEKFVDFARTYRVDGGTLLDDPINRNLVADLRVKIAVFRTLAWQGVWESRQGEDVSRVASMCRVLSGELVQELWRGFTRIVGPAAQVAPYSWDKAPLDGFIGVNALMSTGRTFGHGTKEIQRNIIAQRGLGLPR